MLEVHGFEKARATGEAVLEDYLNSMNRHGLTNEEIDELVVHVTDRGSNLISALQVNFKPF